VNANHEKKVSRFLSAHNVDHYLPLYAEHSQWSDRTALVERPLFPGYLFVRIAPEQRRVVLRAPGVVCLADERNGLGTLTDIDIERLREAAAREYRPHHHRQLTGIK
jgi:transcription antitermination factor NusG